MHNYIEIIVVENDRERNPPKEWKPKLVKNRIHGKFAGQCASLIESFQKPSVVHIFGTSLSESAIYKLGTTFTRAEGFKLVGNGSTDVHLTSSPGPSSVKNDDESGISSRESKYLRVISAEINRAFANKKSDRPMFILCSYACSDVLPFRIFLYMNN